MCISPLQVKNRRVKCNSCRECLYQRQQEYIARAKIEYTKAKKSYFLTLTYNDENYNSFSLEKRDAVLFLKKLRFHLAKFNIKVKYALVGDYGSKFLRKHFHLLLFVYSGDFPDNKSYFFQNIVKKSWSKGFVYVGTVTNASVRYVFRYVFEKTRLNYLEDFKDIQEPFLLLSKGFGLVDKVENYIYMRHSQGYIQRYAIYRLRYIMKKKYNLLYHRFFYKRLIFLKRRYFMPRYYINFDLIIAKKNFLMRPGQNISVQTEVLRL